MTDTPRRDGADPTQPTGTGYPGYPAYSDPAYAGHAPYGPTYQTPYVPPPTEQLPQWPYGYDPYSTGQYGTHYPPGEPPGPPPTEPKSPRWLWVLAAVAVLLVVGMVIALVVANSSQQETVVAPPPMPEPTTTTRTPTTTSRPPTPIIPAPPITPPTESVTPGATETVVYEVNGDGRAINITYVDTGSLLQTEFNVVLPWRKEVELPSPAEDSASIMVVNVGRNVSCSVSINGVQVQQSSGAGLTTCTAVR
ncbi:MAG: MmpS family transport accessory protein [Mycobacterium sp.]